MCQINKGREKMVSDKKASFFSKDIISKKKLSFGDFGLKKEIILSDTKDDVQKSNISDGFYYKDNIMYPEKFSESKTDYVGYALTYGLAGGSTKSILK